MAERGARGRPEPLRHLGHHAHQAERAHCEGQPSLNAKILHPVLHQIHQVSKQFNLIMSGVL